MTPPLTPSRSISINSPTASQPLSASHRHASAAPSLSKSPSRESSEDAENKGLVRFSSSPLSTTANSSSPAAKRTCSVLLGLRGAVEEEDEDRHEVEESSQGADRSRVSKSSGEDMDVSLDSSTASAGIPPSASQGSIASASSSSSDAGHSELPPLHVEVRLLPTSTIRFDLIRSMIASHIEAEYETLLTHSEVEDWKEVGALRGNVERVWIGESTLSPKVVPVSQVSLRIHVYQPTDPSTSSSDFTLASEDDEDPVTAASILNLPAAALEGVWDSLVYEDDVKERLLGYIASTIEFGDRGVDFNIVSWNRVVLLHGPPGTGKTSLCRALAQKLAIRLADRYEHGRLVEINSHSLFSKWFSESGKLVQKLFATITEMVDDESGFVVVLIDEVESLTAARAGAMSGKEPSDALRVVNALLTQLDKLKHRKNCLVMTTSNLSTAIDIAFIDRADIKQYIGLPPPKAVYWILQSCLKEIMRAGLIPSTTLHDWETIEVFRSTGTQDIDRHRRSSSKLYDLSHVCRGMSGRTLRRLPVLAHANYIGMSGGGRPLGMEVWLEAMKKCVEREVGGMDKIEGR